MGGNISKGNPVKEFRNEYNKCNHSAAYRKSHSANSDHKWSGSRFWPLWKVTHLQNGSRYSPPTPFYSLKLLADFWLS